MSLSLSLTAQSLATALSGLLNPVTVEDVCSRLERGGHTLIVLEGWGINSDTEINSALVTLMILANRERSKRDALHWSFEPNKLIALLQHHRSLSIALEARRDS
jgi:hypothetical protein